MSPAQRNAGARLQSPFTVDRDSRSAVASTGRDGRRTARTTAIVPPEKNGTSFRRSRNGMIKNKPPQENIDIYVWEGKSDIFDRIARCLVSADVDVIRADGMEPLPEQVAQSTAIAIISVTVIDSSGFRSEEHTSELQSRENLVCRL